MRPAGRWPGFWRQSTRLRSRGGDHRFPETFVPYYPYFSFITPAISAGAAHLKLYEQAVVVPGPITCAVGERARLRGIVVVLG